ncbi:MAG: hypothetical protein ACTHM9_14280 [Gemmatimonadales bacterium]|jgi:hypothetical protein
MTHTLTPEQWETRDYRQSARDLDAWARSSSDAANEDTTEFVAKIGIDAAGAVVIMNRAHDRVLVPPPARAPLAALTLAEQPFGFTPADVALLRAAADGHAGGDAATALRDLARRIADLLPPSAANGETTSAT